MDAATTFRPDYTPHARAERLIAIGRFVLAFSSLVAVYLDPSTPERYQSTTYLLLLLYGVVAAIAVPIVWRQGFPSRRWQITSHVAELILFSVFVYLTEGPASPFFLYFVFSLFCATLRFTWRGILDTAIASLLIYTAMAVVASFTTPSFDLGRVVIRVTYLAVISALLVYLGLHQHRLRSELSSLAAWPRELAARIDDVLRSTLSHAATVLGAQRVLLVWEESEEPWTYVAVTSGDSFRIDRVAPGTFDATVGAGVANVSVLVRERPASCRVFDPRTSTISEEAGDPLGAGLRRTYDVSNGIVVFLGSETVSVRLIVPDVRTATPDDLALAHVVGRLVLATLEQYFFVQQMSSNASTEERLRISRELHDGIVQSLAGVGLRLHALRGEFEKDSHVAEQLGHVQAVLEHDQRELRSIVRELRPHDTRDPMTMVQQELQRMRDRFPLEWGLEVEVEEVASSPRIPGPLAHELCRIVNESLSNAARHGGATQAFVDVAQDEDDIHIRVRDNGRGFPFTGRHDLAALETLGTGPRTLKERVRHLGGRMVVESSPRGATIDVSIPLGSEGA
jgi:signal transduction histidine kinase